MKGSPGRTEVHLFNSGLKDWEVSAGFRASYGKVSAGVCLHTWSS